MRTHNLGKNGKPGCTGVLDFELLEELPQTACTAVEPPLFFQQNGIPVLGNLAVSVVRRASSQTRVGCRFRGPRYMVTPARVNVPPWSSCRFSWCVPRVVNRCRALL